MIALRPFLALVLAALTLLAPSALAAKPTDGIDEMVRDARENADRLADSVAGERILSYASDITVARDGTLQVTESIRVRAEGDQIRRGIFRDFPTRYQREGRTVRVGFEVDGVTRNGNPEPYTTERIDNGTRVRIGDADTFLTRGEHLYQIRYRTTRQLGFFDNYDELYWNVTGNAWAFPIDRAEVRIRLPQAVAFGNRAFYTGPQGSQATDAEVVSEQPGEILFRTTEGLGPNEGFTVAVAWPKGVVEAPPPPTASQQWLSENGPMGAAILALAGLGFFFYYAWRRAGRGPIPGTVVPLFAPPKDMSAAAVRYVKRMGFDNRCFAAAIVESGVRGKLKLVETDGGFFSGKKIRIEKTGEPDDMPVAERTMLRSLFGGGTAIEMDKKNHATFRAAQTGLREKFEMDYKGKLFLSNLGWAFAGVMMMFIAITFVGMVVLAVDPYGESGSALTAAFAIGLMVLAVGAAGKSRMVAKDGSWLLAIGAILFGLLGILLMFGTMAFADDADGLSWTLAPLLSLPLVISAFWWMAAPTKEGRKVMDEIAGFERYLSATEESRLEVLHPPEKTPELFERYLPYAIALGVENRWAARFASVLAAAAADPNRRDTQMGWYSGSKNVWQNPGVFATAVGASLVSSTAAASTAPGSSSGSGGGGFSGGGGGGGGGGGW